MGLATITLASENFQGTTADSVKWEPVAEQWRTKWIKEFCVGREIKPYSPKVILTVGFNARGGSGETKYMVGPNGVKGGFTMNVRGKNAKEIQDQVLPHEVMHTVMATYMGADVPKWADEGYASLKESPLPPFPRQRLIPFKELMSSENYTEAPLNFYGESTKVVQWLVELKGIIVFRDFIYDFKHTQGDWPVYLKKYYGFSSYDDAQKAWEQWLVVTPLRIKDVSNP